MWKKYRAERKALDRLSKYWAIYQTQQLSHIQEIALQKIEDEEAQIVRCLITTTVTRRTKRLLAAGDEELNLVMDKENIEDQVPKRKEEGRLQKMERDMNYVRRRLKNGKYELTRLEKDLIWLKSLRTLRETWDPVLGDPNVRTIASRMHKRIRL